MLQQVEGIVVRSTDYGEGNKILVIFSKEQGKISLMARGAKKIKSRHAAVSQLFTHGIFTYYKGNASQMGTLNHGEVMTSHRSLQENLEKTAYGSYLVELVDRLFPDQEGSTYVFYQLCAALNAIDENKDSQIITHIFELIMMKSSGYAPVFDSCVSCGKERAEEENVYFSVSSGGFVCRMCHATVSDAKLMHKKTFKLLHLLHQVDLRKLGSISVSQNTKSELMQWMSAYVDYHTNVVWKSRRFIEQMKKYELS